MQEEGAQAKERGQDPCGPRTRRLTPTLCVLMRRILYMLQGCYAGLVLLSGCAESSVQWTEWPIAPGAENIRQYPLGDEGAHQISFEVHAGYPSKAVAEFYSRKVESPWVRCYSDMKWQSFGDATQTPAAFVHQMLLHWVNYEEDRLLLLGIRYISEDATYREFPDNKTQRVHLVEYRQLSVEEAVSALGLDCEHT